LLQERLSAPLKTVTIPRLELCAAVAAVKLARFAIKEVELKIAWKIMVKSVKKILHLTEKKSSESFHTFLIEVECICKHRPLDSCCDHPNDLAT